MKKSIIILLLLSFSVALAAEDDDQSTCELSGYDWIANAHYPATYSFTDETNGTRNPAGWFATEVLPYRYGHILDAAADHAKVQLLFDNDTNAETDTIFLSTVDFPIDKGNFSFWFRMHDPANENGAPNVFGIAEITTDPSTAGPVLVFGNASLGAININSQIACAESLGAGVTLIGSIVKDQWHYVNVEFDNTSSTFNVILDDNSPVSCSLYNSWGATGGTGALFTTGAIIPSGSPDHYIWIDAVNFDWAGESYDSTVAQCCGDDGAGETFYNGTTGVDAVYCTNGQLSYEFLIQSVYYDQFVDLSDENASVQATVFSTSDPSSIIRINVSNAYGPQTLAQNFTCSDQGGGSYQCLWNTSVTDWPCITHNATIYAEGKSGEENISFMIDDLLASYSAPADTFITTNQLLGASYSYCSGNANYTPINVVASLNSSSIINQNSSASGNNLFSYTNPLIAGIYDLTITANDTNYFDLSSLTVNIVKSIIIISPRTVVYDKDKPGYRSVYVEIINPSSITQNYTVSILPVDLNLVFSDNKGSLINLSVAPYSRAVKYLDVFPLIAGSYTAVIQVNTSLASDNSSLELNAVSQSTYQRGLFSYTLTPDTNAITIITLIALVSFFLLKKA